MVYSTDMGQMVYNYKGKSKGLGRQALGFGVMLRFKVRD